MALCCCRLVVQRTKRVDDTQDLLLEMLENLTSGTEQEKQEFMAICVETLKRFKMSDVLTPIFVFERLCNIIRPVSDLEDKAVEWYGCVWRSSCFNLLVCIAARNKTMWETSSCLLRRTHSRRSSCRDACRVTLTPLPPPVLDHS